MHLFVDHADAAMPQVDQVLGGDITPILVPQDDRRCLQLGHFRVHEDQGDPALNHGLEDVEIGIGQGAHGRFDDYPTDGVFL